MPTTFTIFMWLASLWWNFSSFFPLFSAFLMKTLYTFEKDKKMISVSNRVFNKRNVRKFSRWNLIEFCLEILFMNISKKFEIFLILYWLWIIGSTTEAAGFSSNTYLFHLHFYSVFLVIWTLRKYPL